MATSNRDLRTFLLMAQFEAKEIGKRIAQARRESGLTQEELAELAPFSKRSLQDYEGGITIPYRHLREISKLLDRPIEWFLHGQKPEPVDFAAIEVALAEVNRKLDDLDRKVDLADPTARLAAIEQELRRLEPSTRL